MVSKKLPARIITKRFYDDGSIEIERQSRFYLRKGENPNKEAAIYSRDGKLPFIQKHGGLPSYNNIQDAIVSNAAVYDITINRSLIYQEREHTAVIVKHRMITGGAVSSVQSEALAKAEMPDLQTNYGGIVGFNSVVEYDTALMLRSKGHSFDIVIAPGFDDKALKILQKSQRMIVFESHLFEDSTKANSGFYEVTIPGGIRILQGFDFPTIWKLESDGERWSVVTERKPTDKEKSDSSLARILNRYGNSNKTNIVMDGVLLGAGYGDGKRVRSAERAIANAQASRIQLRGASAATDGPIPFPDFVYTVADAGVATIISTGGSKRDAEVKDAMNEKKIAGIFTGLRDFRHSP